MKYKNLVLIKSWSRPGSSRIISSKAYFDSEGNMVKTVDANGDVSEYKYDSYGNITSVIYDGHEIMSFKHTYSSGRLIKTETKHTVTYYIYNMQGHLVKETDDAGENTIMYSYDYKGNMVKKEHHNGFIELYRYNSKGNKISETDSIGKLVLFSYDVNGYLISSQHDENLICTYTYESF